MTKNSPPADINESPGQHAPLEKNAENSEDFPMFADVLKSQYVETNSQYSTAGQLAVLNKVADAARERVLRIWTEKGMAGKDSDAYFKMCADAVKREMEKTAEGSKTPGASIVTPKVNVAPAPEAAVVQKPVEEFVPQNTNNGALTEDIAERDSSASQAATATTPPVSPAKTSQTAVVSPAETSDEKNEPLEFDPEKWKGGGISAKDAYKKYVEKVSREAESAIKELGSLGATDTQKQENERVVRGVRDYVISAAQHEGPIQFTRYLKLDREFQVLRSGRTLQTPAQQEPQAVVAQVGGDRPLKDFSALAALRDTLRPLSATHEPPPAIEAVSGEAPTADSPRAGPISPDDFDQISPEKAAVERLNMLKENIEVQNAIVKANKGVKGKEAREKLASAGHELDRLHIDIKNEASKIVDGKELFARVKPADATATKLYERKTKGVPLKERRKLDAEELKDVADAYFSGDLRKKDFIALLAKKGVEKDVAGELYQEWLDRAGYAVWLRGELEGEKTEKEKVKILRDPYAIKVLQWEGIEASEPKMVLAEIAQIVDVYNTIPPREERPKREESVKKAERQTPARKLLENIKAGQEIPDKVLKSFIKDERTRPEDKAELKAELASREEKRGEDHAMAHRKHVLDVVRSGEGKTVPWEVLKKYSQEPEIAAFLKTFETALTPFPVTIAADDFGALIFHTWKNKIPEGVQVGTASGGGGTSTSVEEADEDESSPGETLKGAWLDFDSFGKQQCAVASVNVNEDSSGHCRVYVNFDVDPNPANAGLNYWGKEGNAYGPLLRSLLGEKYKNVKVSWNGKKVTLRFSDERIALPAKTKTKIVFVAEPSDSSNSPSGIIPESAEHVKSLKDNSMGAPEEEVHADDVATPVESAPTANLEAQNKNPWHPFFGEKAAAEQAELKEIYGPNCFITHKDVADKLWYLEQDAEQKFSSGDEPGLAAARDAIRVFLNEQRATEAARKSAPQHAETGYRAPGRPAKTEEEKNAILERFKKYLADGTFRDGETYAMRNSAGEVAKGVLMYLGPEGKVRMYTREDGKTNLCDPKELIELNSEAVAFENVKSPASDGSDLKLETDQDVAGVRMEGVASSSETLESLTEKARIVGRVVWLGWDKLSEGESLESHWGRVAPLGMQWFHDAIVLANPNKFDEERFNARDPEYLKSCALWLRHQYDTVIVPALEKAKVASAQTVEAGAPAPVADAGDLLEMDRKDMPTVPTLTDDVEHGKAEKTWAGFDPERELDFILQLPKDVRKEKLAEYKIKLAWQRKGLARAQATAIEAIRANPDVTDKEFMNLFEEQAAKFEASETQYARALEIFDKYKQKHEAVEKYYAEYPDPKELFHVVFGVEAKGDVEVVKGPMTLYFRLKEEDYVNAFGDAGLREDKTVPNESRRDALGTGGCHKGSSLVPGLKGTLILELNTSENGSDWSKEVYAHEEQHAINELFQEDFRYQRQNEKRSKSWEEIYQASSPEEFHDAVVRYLRAWRSDSEDSGRASDEIFAYLREGSSPDRILSYLTDAGRKNYNYYDEDKKSIRERIAKLREEKFTDEEKKIYEEVATQVFEKEYKELVAEGLTAYEELKKNGFTDEGVRAVLLHEPLQRWAKVVERILNPGNALPESVASGFEEQFGIEQQDLLNVEGFKKLSEGQQLLVLKNLEQIALTDIKKEAQVKQKEEWKDKAWWKKLLLGAGSAGSYGYARTKGIEKELLATVRGGQGTDPERAKILVDQLANIEQLVKVAAEGPEVNVGADGELEMLYVQGKDLFESNDDPAFTPEHKKVLAEFNATATAFAKLPREWGYEPKDEKEKKENKLYSEKRGEYLESRTRMLQLYRDRFATDPTRKGGSPDGAAMLAMNEFDERMELNQLFNAHPDAEQALANIEDQSVVREGLKDFWRDKGKYLALGAGIRIGAAVATGGVMAPLIALGLGGAVGLWTGGLQGRNEAKKLIRERRIGRRMSEEDEREEIEYVVPTYTKRIVEAEGELERTDLDPKDREKLKFELNDAKTRLARDGEIPKERWTRKRRIKEFTDATFFVDRIERLSLKLEATTDPKERELLEGKIVQTTALMEEKYESGLINFGGSSLEGSDERKGNTIANRLSFIQAIGQGHAVEIVDPKKLEAAITPMIGVTRQRREKMSDLEQKEVLKAAGLAGLKRMGYALAGGYAAGKAIGWLKEANIFSGFVPSGGVAKHLNLNRNTADLPNDLILSGRGGEAKTFEDYMPTNDAYRAPLDPKTVDLLTQDSAGAGVLAEGNPDAYDPGAFSSENFAKNIPSVVGRTPSPEELTALRSTGGVDVPAQANMEQHTKLILEMKKSPTPLTHEQIELIQINSLVDSIRERALSTRPPWLAPNEEIVSPESVREGMGGVVSSPAAPGVAERSISDLPLAEVPPGSELLPYHVASGDNFTKILKTNIPELSSLSPKGQDNAIQNLLKSLSPEELRAIGGPKFTDPNKLAIDQTIDLNKVIQLLHEKKVGGENLLERAAHLEGEAPVSTRAEQFNPDQVKAVTDAIRNAPNTTRIDGVVVPDELVMSGREAEVKAFEEYMTDTNPSHRAQLLETIGKTKEQMDAEIAELLAKGHVVQEAIPRPAGTPLSMGETAATWRSLPEEMKLPQAQLEAGRYLDADIERLFPKPLFAPVSPEWLSIRDRDALMILETDPRTLSGTPELSEGYDWPTVAKIQQYIAEQGITKENGYMPTEKETLADFLKRALAEKVLRDGPSRPFVEGRIHS